MIEGRRLGAVLTPLFIALLLSGGVFFFLSEIQVAGGKPLWVDEQFARETSVHTDSFLSLLIKGARAQGSPSPLDYFLLKGWEAARRPVSTLGLQPLAYLRLNSILVSLLAGMLVALWAWRTLKPVTWSVLVVPLLVLNATLRFWFDPFTTAYAVEMRPYALWNALWFVALGWCLFFPRRQRVLMVLLILLALTANASLFQISALLLAYVLAEWASGERWSVIAKRAAGIFAAPLAVSLYYCFRAGQFGYTDAAWGTFTRFWEFWWGQKNVLLTSAFVAVLGFLSPRTRRSAVPALAVAILYLMGPLIFYVTRSKGFFFSERQYIYYAVALPVFVLSLAVLYQHYAAVFPGRSFRWLAGGLLVALVAFNFSHGLRTKFRAAKVALRDDSSFSFIHDPKKVISRHLESELPAAFCLPAGAQPNDTRMNFGLLTDWLPVKYSVPQGKANVHLSSVNGRLSVEAIDERPCRGDRIAVAAP